MSCGSPLPPATRVDIEAASHAVHRAESALAQEAFHSAWGPAQVAMFVAARPFLPGEDAPWIEETRRSLADLHVRALEAYARAGLGIGGTELPAAVRTGRYLIRLEPYRETGYQLLMHALARQPRRSTPCLRPTPPTPSRRPRCFPKL
jgi:SARP family transcriptional regulator, regulator of embCAB operon